MPKLQAFAIGKISRFKDRNNPEAPPKAGGILMRITKMEQHNPATGRVEMLPILDEEGNPASVVVDMKAGIKHIDALEAKGLGKGCGVTFSADGWLEWVEGTDRSMAATDDYDTTFIHRLAGFDPTSVKVFRPATVATLASAADKAPVKPEVLEKVQTTVAKKGKVAA